MHIAVLGTGMVGQTIAGKLIELNHDVMIGTRNVAETLARAAPDRMGRPPFSAWHAQHPKANLGTFADAAAFGEIVFNCTSGMASLAVLELAGAESLKDKVLIDVSNPLDFSKGMPPSLSVCNTDSLGEQIQRALPETKVVKTLNTVNCSVMIDPALVKGDHDIFVSGNDPEAKATVTHILKDWFGWRSVIDLGDITTARGVEMTLPIWLSLVGVLKTSLINIKVVH